MSSTHDTDRSNRELVYLPNLSLANAVILNMALPDTCSRRAVDVVIDYDRSVESAERIPYAAALGEGMAKRSLTDREGSKVVQERFIATEFFGRRSLFACQAQAATVLAETAVLAYELDRHAVLKLFEETPELIQALALALAQLSWRESNAGNADVEPQPAVIERLVNVFRGQIESNYGDSVFPARPVNIAVPAA